MPEETIQEILKALTERFRKTTSSNFLPKVSIVKTGFRLGGDSRASFGLGGGANTAQGGRRVSKKCAEGPGLLLPWPAGQRGGPY